MIDFISNWAGELIVSLIIVTIIEMLLPDSKIKKYVKVVIGVYIIFCIMSPFIDKEQISTIYKEAEKSLEKAQIKNQVSSSQYSNTSIEELYIQEFEKDVKNRVEDLGYKVNLCKVDIIINASKDDAGINSIYLEIGEKTNNTNIESIEKVEISINDKAVGNNKTEESDDIKKVKEFLTDYYKLEEEKIKITQN